jgi:hypothetical protein
MKANQDLNVANHSDSDVREKISATLFEGGPCDKFDAAARNSFFPGFYQWPSP